MSKRKIYNGKFTNTQVNEILNYFKELYPQKEDCFVKIFSKSTKEYKFYNIHSLNEVGKLKNILNSFGKNDLMISSNTFKSMDKATESNLFSINTICVDIDYKKSKYYGELPPENVIKMLEMDYFNYEIPYPNYIEYGNQLRLIYKLSEPVYIPKGKVAVKTLCNRVSECFSTILKEEFNAETQKSEKFIRIPYSINTKTMDTVNIIHYSDETYTLNELKENWLDETPQWYEKWKSKKTSNAKNKVKSFNALEFNQKRLSDFRKIQNYLNQNDIKDFRNRLCFLYHNYSLLVHKNNPKFNGNITEQAIADMLEFNSNFKYPERENKLISDTKFLRSKQYKYGNEEIMEFLELNDDLCRELYLESIFKVKSKELVNKEYYEENKDTFKKYYLNNKDRLLEYKKTYIDNNKETIKDYNSEYYNENKEYISINKKEKYQEKLKQEGKLTKKEKLEEVYCKIKNLRIEGLKNKDIAKVLNLPVKTLERHITYLKKNGLL